MIARAVDVTGRGLLIGVGALFLFVLIFGRAIARFYVDYLWHKSLGRGDVFWGVIGAKFTLFVGFFLLFLVIVGVQPVHRRPSRAHVVSRQRAPVRRAVPRRVRPSAASRPLRRGRPASPWSSRCRRSANGRAGCCSATAREFGVADEQFHVDVGFYVFQLPFLIVRARAGCSSRSSSC